MGSFLNEKALISHKMGYFQDILDVFLLKDKTYKKLANDNKTFRRFFVSYLVSSYIVYGFFAMLIGLAMLVFMPIGFVPKPDMVLAGIAIGIGVILILPFVLFVIQYVLTLIPYIIGLMFGGTPRKYSDFFKILHFTLPVQIPLTAFFNEIANPVFGVWHFFILHKTYKVVHRMNSSQAMWAVIVYLILVLFVIAVMVLLFFSFLGPIMALANTAPTLPV